MIKNINIKINWKTLLIIFCFSTFVLSCFSSFFFHDSDAYAATSANVKTDFGAVGDGVADDTTAILNAFASSYDEIVFPEGEYLFTQQLLFGTGDKTITGTNATLFTDDTYRTVGTAYQNEWAIRIRNVNNITINGMRFEPRQKTYNLVFGALVGVMDAENIHFNNCVFYTPPDLPDPMMHPLDFWGNWRNVSVTNSTSIMHHTNYVVSNKESGGSFMFRNFNSNNTCEDAVFTNNVVEKNNHDEILWVATNSATAVIDGMVVTGNRFYYSEPASAENTLVHSISFYGLSDGSMKNIDFNDNEVIGRGTGRMLGLSGLENAQFYNNDFYEKVDPGGASSVVSSFYTDSALNTSGTVEVRDNRTIAVDADDILISLTTGTNPFSFSNNKNITIKAGSVNYMINHVGGFTGNNVELYGNAYRSDGGGVISPNANIVEDNNITINGWADVIMRHFSGSGAAMAYDKFIKGNTIITTEKRPFTEPTDVYTRLIRMWNFSMDGKTIAIRDNTFINGYDIEMDDTNPPIYTWASPGSNTVTDNTPVGRANNVLWGISVLDAVPEDQTFIFCNNTVKGYRTMSGNKSATVELTCD